VLVYASIVAAPPVISEGPEVTRSSAVTFLARRSGLLCIYCKGLKRVWSIITFKRSTYIYSVAMYERLTHMC
jgi:hypothetical protein